MLDKGQVTGLLSPLLEKWRMYKVSRHIRGGHILDCGCGSGKFLEYNQDFDYTGVDINRDVIRYAQKKHADRKNTRILTIPEFIESDKKYDSIIMIAVLEHLDHPVDMIQKLKETLKKGGRIVITTPTPQTNRILKMGSKMGLFIKEAFEEHKSLLERSAFVEIAKETGLHLNTYQRFQCGLNQLVVFSYD